MNRTMLRSLGLIATGLALFTIAAEPAEARRGGSFGSRGARTHMAPPPTVTAPKVAPVQRTMTERPAANPASRMGQNAAPAAAGRSGGLAKGLIGGLIAGGLIGMLLGNGFGALNGSGILMALLQGVLLGGLVWLAFRLFRRRSGAAPATGPAFATAGGAPFAPTTGGDPAAVSANPFAQAQQEAQAGNGHGNWGAAAATAPVMRDLAITNADKADFERLLGEVQDAFAREDYGSLRALTTPEVMSYLAEELSENATQGRRNAVSGTELLDAEVAEAWSEDDADYATIAMHYQSIDVLLDRTSGAVISGDPAQPTRTRELWTFVRDARNPWRLSAIQEA